MRRLESKVAIVTGAGSGFGEATARLMAREGEYASAILRERVGDLTSVEPFPQRAGRCRWHGAAAENRTI